MPSSSKTPAAPSPYVVSGRSYTYHAHSAGEVLSLLGVAETGLVSTEVQNRRARDGSNSFTPPPPHSVLRTVLKQLKSPLTLVLVAALLVTFLLAEYVDAGVIALALLIAVVVGVLQEEKASRAFAHLAASQTLTAIVIRDGVRHQIPLEEVVVGDVVALQSGAQVPADMRLIHAKTLSVNEAALTGEWQAVAKQVKAVPVGTPFAEQTSMVWRGTYVADGNGLGVVVATGDRTVMGALAKEVAQVEEVLTPLQHEMARISELMLWVILVLVTSIFFIGIFTGHELTEMLIMAIAIAVASVPEGLPAAITIILAVGMEALLKRGGLVRNLLAAETLGSTTYVLTDKTGTLTKATMAATGVILPDTTTVPAARFTKTRQSAELFSVAITASDAFVETKDGKQYFHGDPVEQAFLKVARKLGVGAADSRYRSNRIDYLAFSSERRYAAGLSEYKPEQFRLCVTGAPSTLLAAATKLLSEHGVTTMNEHARAALTAAIAEQTAAGRRLVAVAYADVAYDSIPEHGNILTDLVLVGVVVLEDPVRDGVKEAIAGVSAAGARIMLITGDNPQTALSIAQQVGIAGAGEQVLTGPELEQLGDDELLLALLHVHVYARVLPKQKLRIATLLQQRGEVVAMTGDGINDAPALRRANIGIAIGSGTEVAKESSDLVLVDDSFATIYAAIEEGRRIIANVRKIVGYLLSTSLSEVVLIGTALLVGGPLPILPAQILWANVIEEGLMSVAFAFEKGEPDAMRRKPRDIHEEGILSHDMRWFIALVVSVLALLTLTLYFYVLSLKLPIETVRSIMFLSVAIDSLFMSFAFRSLTTPLWKIPLSNNWFFIGSFVLSALLLVAALSVPFLQYVLSYTPLPANYIMLVIAFSVVSLAVIEVAKWLFFEKRDLVVE